MESLIEEAPLNMIGMNIPIGQNKIKNFENLENSNLFTLSLLNINIQNKIAGNFNIRP